MNKYKFNTQFDKIYRGNCWLLIINLFCLVEGCGSRVSKMSQLPKIANEEREAKFGYVYGVSGPGTFFNFG